MLMLSFTIGPQLTPQLTPTRRRSRRQWHTIAAVLIVYRPVAFSRSAKRWS
jgi:hypothetical protein